MIGITWSTRVFIFSNDIIFSISAITIGVYFLISKYSESRTIASALPDKYYRTRKDKMFLGVCGGLSKYLNIDSTFLRIIFVLAGLLTLGIFSVVYIILSLSVNYEEKQKFE